MNTTLKLTSNMDADTMQPYWPEVLEQLEQYVAMYPAYATLDKLLSEIVAGNFQLWIVLGNDTNKVVMSVVTRIATSEANGERALNIYALAGEELAAVTPHLDDIVAWAKKHFNVSLVELTGRPGISRVLRPYGFTCETVTMNRSC